MRVRENSNFGHFSHSHNPDGNYIIKVNNRNTGTRCEICLKLTVKTPERRQTVRHKSCTECCKIFTVCLTI